MAELTGYKKEVYNTAIEQGASDFFAKLIIAQLQHESADFKSNVFKKNNNANGMKFPSKRKSGYVARRGTKPPGNEGATPYAYFNSLADNVRDLFHWLKYNGIDHRTVLTVEDYAERLRARSYMGNTEGGKRIYIAGLSRWFKKLVGEILSSPPTVQSAAKGLGIAILLFVILITFVK